METRSCIRGLDKGEINGNNKAVHKLKGLPPVYVSILMVNHIVGKQQRICLKYWEVKDYTRISAYDGREDDLGDILKGRYPDAMTSGEVGCTTSHLKAMKEFLEDRCSMCNHDGR